MRPRGGKDGSEVPRDLAALPPLWALVAAWMDLHFANLVIND